MFYYSLDIKTVALYGMVFLSLYFVYKPKKYTENKNNQKIILITGCDSGFGKDLVKSAIDAGFRVIAACYTELGAKEFTYDQNTVTVIAALSQENGSKKVVNFT